MSKRKVTLKLTTQKDLIKGESAARTFGELKSEMTDVKWDGMRVVVRETKNTLQDDAALLPAGEFVLFLVPEKVKSGMGDKKKLKKLREIDVDSATYNDLRSHASILNKLNNAGIAMNGGTDDLRKAVKAYYAALETPGVEDDNAALAAIEEARSKINAAIDQIIATASVHAEDTTDYVVKVSVEDLETEVQEIRKALKL